MQPAVLDDDGADVDRGVEVAVPGEVADRAAVGAALDRLQLVDDLHRPHLRRPGQRPRRQRRAQHVHRADPLAQSARDLADDVEDVGVGLDDHQLVDRDRAVLADPAEVVAAEVDQHHVLGPLLRVVDQPLGEAAVLVLAAPARRGAGDRPRLDPVAGDLDQRLRRGAGDLEVAELEEVHVGRRVDRAQAAVDREGLDRAPAPRSAARGRPGRRRRRGRTRRSASTAASNCSRSMLETNSRRLGDRGAARDRHGAAQALAHLGDRRGGALVGGVDPAVLLGEGAGEDRQLVPQVVEDDHRVGHHQRHVGKPERVGVGLAERLHRAHQVVAEEADGAAGERRQALDRGRPELGQAGGDGAVGVGRRLAAARPGAGGGLLPAPLRERAVAPAQQRPRSQADEGVAADLALLGRLQQEAGRPRRLAGAQLEEGGDRRLAVVDEAGAHRHHVALPGQLPRLLQARLEPQLVSHYGHSALPSPPTGRRHGRPAAR